VTRRQAGQTVLKILRRFLWTGRGIDELGDVAMFLPAIAMMLKPMIMKLLLAMKKVSRSLLLFF